MILNALETEKDPRTGSPFFPGAITSRLATGWPILFNHLEPHNLEKITFSVETDSLTPELKPLFFPDENAEILIYGDTTFADHCREAMPGFIFYDTCNVEEALTIAGEKNIRMVLLDIAEKSRTTEEILSTVYEEDLLLSVGAFDNKPMAAGAFRDGGGLFRKLRERLPELPVYLLEKKDFVIDEIDAIGRKREGTTYGRAAEIVYYGEKDGVSTGAAGDLENATKLAAAMISSYGMDEDFGLAYMEPRDAMKDPDFRRKVNELLRGEMRRTVEILQENRARIDRLVSELMKKNKLTAEEMETLLKE